MRPRGGQHRRRPRRCQEKKVDAENPKQVFDFYMFVWKIFYAL